jgi:hypothetical protein
MNNILKEMLGIKIEINSSNEDMKIDVGETNGSLYANLENISINPKIVHFNNIQLKRTGLKLDFNAPIICNLGQEDITESMMLGVKFEGKDKDLFSKEIEEKIRNFGPEWENAVKRRREEILSRNGLLTKE